MNELAQAQKESLLWKYFWKLGVTQAMFQTSYSLPTPPGYEKYRWYSVELSHLFDDNNGMVMYGGHIAYLLLPDHLVGWINPYHMVPLKSVLDIFVDAIDEKILVTTAPSDSQTELARKKFFLDLLDLNFEKLAIQMDLE